MKYQFITILLLLGSISCDLPQHYYHPAPPCASSIAEMDLENQLKEETQKTLREKIRGRQASEFRYFFETFTREAGETYMVTNFRNESDCFHIKLHIASLGNLKGMYRTNGVSYPKELHELTWELKEIAGKEVVAYLDMHNIID